MVSNPTFDLSTIFFFLVLSFSQSKIKLRQFGCTAEQVLLFIMMSIMYVTEVGETSLTFIVNVFRMQIFIGNFGKCSIFKHGSGRHFGSSFSKQFLNKQCESFMEEIYLVVWQSQKKNAKFKI